MRVPERNQLSRVWTETAFSLSAAKYAVCIG
jgi:hypothetical protein